MSLRNLSISTTLVCNETCEHCWVSAGPERSDDLTTAEVEDVLRQASDLGAEHVKFTGGEPLSRSDLLDLVAYAHALGLRVSIETNGLLLDRRFLERVSRRGSSPHLYVSLDGATPATHDRFRMRPGAFDRTIANLKLAREAGFYFSVHTVLRRANASEAESLHELARELGATHHKIIVNIHNLGRGAVARRRQELSVTEVLEVLGRLPDQEFWDYGWNPEPDRDTRLMTTLPPALQPPGVPITTCGWSQSFMAVLANGSVALCHGLYDVEQALAGNVRKHSLRDLWETSALFRETREWTGTSLAGVCHNCKVNDTCRGLCRASAIGAYDDLRAPYPMCQALYDQGLFPSDMLRDPSCDSSYRSAA